MFLAVGTSGVVYPAAGLVLEARAAGGEAWLVNAEAGGQRPRLPPLREGAERQGAARALRVGLSAAVLAVAAAVAAAPALDLPVLERARVLTQAEAFLGEEPVTLTATSSPRSPGGPHEFFSEGDYWWPDPASPAAPTSGGTGRRTRTTSWATGRP